MEINEKMYAWAAAQLTENEDEIKRALESSADEMAPVAFGVAVAACQSMALALSMNKVEKLLATCMRAAFQKDAKHRETDKEGHKNESGVT